MPCLLGAPLPIVVRQQISVGCFLLARARRIALAEISTSEVSKDVSLSGLIIKLEVNRQRLLVERAGLRMGGDDLEHGGQEGQHRRHRQALAGDVAGGAFEAGELAEAGEDDAVAPRRWPGDRIGDRHHGRMDTGIHFPIN